MPDNSKTNDYTEDDLPFSLDNMKTGTMSELPVTEADGSITERKNPEDDEEFVPPSEAKQEDVLDPLTKAAVKAGHSLDRAVDAGRRMAASGEEPTPEQQIEDQVAESAAAPQRIVQYRMPTTSLLDSPSLSQKHAAKSRVSLKKRRTSCLILCEVSR